MPESTVQSPTVQTPAPRQLWPTFSSSGWLPAFPGGSEAEPEPEAGRQDAEVPGSTLRLCPSFSGHPERRGQLGKGRGESVQRAGGRRPAGVVTKLASLPRWGQGTWLPPPGALSPSALACMAGLPLALSSGQRHGGQGRDQSGAQVPEQLLQADQAEPGQEAHSVSPLVPLREAEMSHSSNTEPRSFSPLLPEEKPDTRERPPRWPLPGLPGLPKRPIRSNAGILPSPEVSGSAPTPRGRRVSPRTKALEESPLRLSRLRTQPASMRMRVQALALLRGLRIRHRRELWCGSQTRPRSGVAVALA